MIVSKLVSVETRSSGGKTESWGEVFPRPTLALTGKHCLRVGRDPGRNLYFMPAKFLLGSHMTLTSMSKEPHVFLVDYDNYLNKSLLLSNYVWDVWGQSLPYSKKLDKIIGTQRDNWEGLLPLVDASEARKAWKSKSNDAFLFSSQEWFKPRVSWRSPLA